MKSKTKKHHPILPAMTILLLSLSVAFCGIWVQRFGPPQLSFNDAKGTPSHRLTLEEIQAGIVAAEQRRLALLKPDSQVPSAEIASRWGIEVLGLYRAAAGRMLDFRYRVIDADKAAPLFDSREQPVLIDEHSQAKYSVPNFPKIGALRTTNRGGNIHSGKIYTILFGGNVRSGDQATIEIGDFRVEHLTVR